MDLDAIVTNRLTSTDENQLRDGQQRAFANALAVYFGLDGQVFEPAVLADLAGRECWMRGVADGLAALCKYQPDMAAFYPKFVEYHVPLDPGSRSEGAFGISVTSRDAPGVIGFSSMPPLAQAETFSLPSSSAAWTNWQLTPGCRRSARRSSAKLASASLRLKSF